MANHVASAHRSPFVRAEQSDHGDALIGRKSGGQIEKQRRNRRRQLIGKRARICAARTIDALIFGGSCGVVSLSKGLERPGFNPTGRLSTETPFGLHAGPAQHGLMPVSGCSGPAGPSTEFVLATPTDVLAEPQSTLH